MWDTDAVRDDLCTCVNRCAAYGRTNSTRSSLPSPVPIVAEPVRCQAGSFALAGQGAETRLMQDSHETLDHLM